MLRIQHTIRRKHLKGKSSKVFVDYLGPEAMEFNSSYYYPISIERPEVL